MLGNFLKHLFAGKSPPVLHSSGRKDSVETIEGTAWLARMIEMRNQGRHADIEAGCRAMLASHPDHIDAVNFLAAALLAQGKSAAGIACLHRAIDLAPLQAENHALLAGVLAATGDAGGAIEAYRQAVRLRPGFTHAWHNLASLLGATARYDEAEESCLAGLTTDCGHAGLHVMLSDVLFEQGRVDAAIQAVRTALVRDPENPAAHSALLRMLNYSDEQDPGAIYAEHLKWEQRHARPLESQALPNANAPDPDRRLRVGYVSPYLRKHAVTFFLESVIQHHDRAGIEIFLYADVGHPDDYALRLQSYGANWRRALGLDDAQLAQLIRNDAIDILIDLSGHTRNNRLLAFARRPAPIQVNWLGFPCTTGMSSMDYRITDAYCDPPGTTEHLNSEQLVRLPHIYMAWRAPDDTPEVSPLPARDAGYVTFGSFHSCFKITPAISRLWIRILHAMPRSRLKLLAVSSCAAERRLRRLFDDKRIDPERIVFLPRLAFEDYLTAFSGVDIALDTFPYHGATTTCFALWMGLPVIVLAGQTHASRADVSMLSNVGLPELIAHDADGYVRNAVHLASDLDKLARLRAGLRDMMTHSPITDGRSCARRLENALREMWVKWCREMPAR